MGVCVYDDVFCVCSVIVFVLLVVALDVFALEYSVAVLPLLYCCPRSESLPLPYVRSGDRFYSRFILQRPY